MNYKILIIIGLGIVIGLVLYNNSLHEPFEASMDESTTDTSNDNNEPEIPVSPHKLLYKDFIRTDCKNDYCCEDGMIFNKELGVCIKKNDSYYISEFNAIGVEPVPPPKIEDLR